MNMGLEGSTRTLVTSFVAVSGVESGTFGA